MFEENRAISIRCDRAEIHDSWASSKKHKEENRKVAQDKSLFPFNVIYGSCAAKEVPWMESNEAKVTGWTQSHPPWIWIY